MKKLFFAIFFVFIICISLIFVVSAQDIYLEEIPADLKVSGDTVTHFIVIDGEEYFTGNGNKINNFNTTYIDEQLTKLGISKNDLGTKYLTKLIIPDSLNGNTVTTVDINNYGTFKKNVYFNNTCGYLSFPSTMTTTNDANDCNKQIRCIDFGENSQLTAIPYCFMLNASKLIRLLNMPKNLTSIAESSFGKCTLLEGDENKQLYISARSIGFKAFDDAMQNVESIVFGENVASMSSEAFSNSPGRSVGVKYIEFKCDVTNVSFPNCNSSANTGAFYFGSGTQRTSYSNLKCIILSNPAQVSCDGKTFVEASGQNVYFNNTTGDNVVYTFHMLDTENATISYESFMKSGTITAICKNCGKQEASSTPALFSYNGISTPINGEIKIAISFFVNFEAIEQYEKISGNTVKFGVTAALEKAIGTNITPLNNDASAKENVVKAKIDMRVVSYDFIITGFTEASHKSLKLLLATYIEIYNANNDLTQIVYLQDKQVENNEFSYVSYNDYV